jgi:cytidine deaminase
MTSPLAGARRMADQMIDELIARAATVRMSAYVPYSGFPVGAALLCADGRIYTACNVENASYGLTQCAERNAVACAVADGQRAFAIIAVVSEGGVTPCGACRQVLAEFGPDMLVVVADAAGSWKEYSIRELLPDAFGPGDLQAA